METAKELLASMRENFLKLNSEEQRKVWDVLVALRGPDQHGLDALKEASTALVRAAVFGELAGDLIRQHSFVNFSDQSQYVEQRVSAEASVYDSEGVSLHFMNHIKKAFAALGLHWYDNNGDVKAY